MPASSLYFRAVALCAALLLLSLSLPCLSLPQGQETKPPASTLTKEQLDNFGQQLSSGKSFILEVTGGTDSTGPDDYNYALSQRRADAVVQYLATKYNVPARRFYLIGIGKDKEVAPNNTADGRKQNRRVEVRMLSNSGEQNASAPANPGSGR